MDNYNYWLTANEEIDHFRTELGLTLITKALGVRELVLE